MKKIGLNTYLYAPKEDLKHRANWRDLYTSNESGRFHLISVTVMTILENIIITLDDLLSLINCAKENNITFTYALSPGLDISYSNNEELIVLKTKLKQVINPYCQM